MEATVSEVGGAMLFVTSISTSVVVTFAVEVYSCDGCWEEEGIIGAQLLRCPLAGHTAARDTLAGP